MMMQEREVFRERVKVLLWRKKMTQKELATRIGLTDAALSRIVTGDRRCDMETLAKIANELEVSADYLMGLEDSKCFGNERI